MPLNNNKKAQQLLRDLELCRERKMVDLDMADGEEEAEAGKQRDGTPHSGCIVWKEQPINNRKETDVEKKVSDSLFCLKSLFTVSATLKLTG